MEIKAFESKIAVLCKVFLTLCCGRDPAGVSRFQFCDGLDHSQGHRLHARRSSFFENAIDYIDVTLFLKR